MRERGGRGWFDGREADSGVNGLEELVGDVKIIDCTAGGVNPEQQIHNASLKNQRIHGLQNYREMGKNLNRWRRPWMRWALLITEQMFSSLKLTVEFADRARRSTARSSLPGQPREWPGRTLWFWKVPARLMMTTSIYGDAARCLGVVEHFKPSVGVYPSSQQLHNSYTLKKS